MARPYTPRKATKNTVASSVDAIGKALGELLSAYEAQGAAITQAQHNKVFNHLRGSLAVIQDKCDNARTLGAITGGGFSLDGPEPAFISEGDAPPVSRIASIMQARPVLIRPTPPSEPTETLPATTKVFTPSSAAVPVGRLSKHSPDADAGKVLTLVPAAVVQAPPNVPDEADIDFLEN